MLLGMSVLIFGMITLLQSTHTVQHHIPEDCENLESCVVTCLRTGLQTTAAQLMFTWVDHPGAWKSAGGLSQKSCMTGVWQSLCYIYYIYIYLPACLPDTPWSTAFLEEVLVSLT